MVANSPKNEQNLNLLKQVEKATTSTPLSRRPIYRRAVHLFVNGAPQLFNNLLRSNREAKLEYNTRPSSDCSGTSDYFSLFYRNRSDK